MAKTSAANLTAQGAWSYGNAAGDQFAKEDVQNLGKNADLHDHTTATKGLPVNIIPSGDLTLTTGNLVLSAAASRIVPGATSLSLRNTANSADNLIVTDAGAVTIRAGLTVTAGTTAVALPLNLVGAGVAMGGGANATLGTIGGSGPTSAGQSGWAQFQVGGVTRWFPYWA